MLGTSIRLGLAAALLNLLGCSNAIHYTVQPAEPISEADCAVPAPKKNPEEFVGVALSGGGSRASVFSAATLEALWEHGMVDLVTHVSSVSGGSIAGSYFGANLPTCDALTSTSEQETCWREFFTDYKQAMRYGFMGSMSKRQLATFRGYSASRLAISLQEILDENFLHGMTFGDLADKNASMVNEGLFPPVMLINATSYDDGRRVVFSNQCLSDNPTPVDNDIVGNPLNSEILRSLPLMPVACTQPTEQDIPISLAATSSAAFPGFVGPITFKVPLTCEGEGLEYWHIGDGGLSDNSGINTLEEVLLREHRAESSKLQRALFIQVASMVDEDPAELRQIDDFWVMTYHTASIVSAINKRGDGYHELFWEKFSADLAADGLPVEILEFAIMDATVDQWPASCPQGADTEGQSPEEIRANISLALASIATSYSVPECGADLLEVAAHNIVHERLNPETIERLNSLGFAVRTTPVSH
jgi:hypothetical protein